MLVEVIEARGSVPRGTGTRMLVNAHGVAGTIGGGHLELQSIALARERLAAAKAEPLDWVVALGPSLGQCCGGTLTLRLQALTPALVQVWPTTRPLFRLHLFGAGHVGRALVNVLAGVPCEVYWVDEREAEFPDGPTPAHVRQVCAEPVQAEVAAGRPGDLYLVLTHSHALDLALAEAILRRGDFGWFGLIESCQQAGTIRTPAPGSWHWRGTTLADELPDRVARHLGQAARGHRGRRRRATVGSFRESLIVHTSFDADGTEVGSDNDRISKVALGEFVNIDGSYWWKNLWNLANN